MSLSPAKQKLELYLHLNSTPTPADKEDLLLTHTMTSELEESRPDNLSIHTEESVQENQQEIVPEQEVQLYDQRGLRFRMGVCRLKPLKVFMMAG